MTAETSAWRTRGCTIAGRQFGEWCGEPIHGAVLVRTYAVPLDPGPEEIPQVGAVLACRHHFAGLTAPPFPPDLDSAAPPPCFRYPHCEAREACGWPQCAESPAADPTAPQPEVAP